MSTLSDLREQVRQIDGELLALVGRRMEAIRAIGQLKREAGQPLRNWEVEREVLRTAEAAAHGAGIPPALARALMQQLIAESRMEQERSHWSSYRGDLETILVIGAAGRMGRWLTAFFREQGHEVLGFDNAAASAVSAGDLLPRLEDGLERASAAFIAVSLDATAAVIDQLAGTRYQGVICDIASLKEHLRPSIERARRAGRRITSLHPMFGPSARTLADKVICVCDCGDAEATARVEALFHDTAATLVRLSLAEHDHAAAYVLGLSHLINILFVRVLAECGDQFATLARVGSTTFSAQITTSETVMREDAELYWAIQRLNPFTPKVYASLMRAAAELTGEVMTRDRQAFVGAMQRGRAWMEGLDAHAD